MINNYLFMLDAFQKLCLENRLKLLFAYAPSYGQIHNPGLSLKIRDLLRDHCTSSAIPFLDLTDIMRQEGTRRPLHLAPVDFHHNPDGNRVIAGAVARSLVENQLLPDVVAPSGDEADARSGSPSGR
jgi:hypothetical protein